MRRVRGSNANVFAGIVMASNFCYVKSMKTPNTLTVYRRVKDFLTDAEIKQFLEAARLGTHGARDYLLALLAYRHGFRVSELIDVRIEEIDLKSARNIHHTVRYPRTAAKRFAGLWRK